MSGFLSCSGNSQAPFAHLQVQRRLFGEHLRAMYGLPAATGRVLGRWTALLRRWRDAPGTDAAYQAAAPLQFYDTWVARDADGDLFAKTAPYARRAQLTGHRVDASTFLAHVAACACPNALKHKSSRHLLALMRPLCVRSKCQKTLFASPVWCYDPAGSCRGMQ